MPSFFTGKAGRAVWFLCALSLMLCLPLTASCAWAHASLIETQPPEAAVLDRSPAAIALHFNESVAPLVFKLVSPDGTIQALSQTSVIDDGLSILLPASGVHGTYLLSWRVVSTDGHPVGGSLTYSVGAASGSNASAISTSASTSSATLLAAIWLARFGLYVVLFAAIGAVLFRAFLSRDTEPVSYVNPALAVGGGLLILAIGAQGLDAMALAWNGLLAWDTWKTSMATAYGRTALLLLAALIAARIGNGRQIAKAASGLALVLLATAIAASGHAASAPPVWLARPAVFIHILMLTLWIGSLLPLWALLRPTSALSANTAPAALASFSNRIPWVVFLLVASGTTLALLQIDRLDALWRSDYGRIFGIKMMLFALLLIVAAWNRYVLTAGVRLEQSRARRRMAHAILIEIFLVLLILAAATTWRFTPPPRALDTVRPAPSHVHIHQAQAMADLTLTPQDGRRLRAELFVMGSDESPLKPKEMTLQFSNPAMGIEALSEDLHADPVGTWSSASFALPSPGIWHVRIDMLVSDFESITLEQDIDIAF
ncbi:copper resistance protein CopC [Herbaspirillum sp. RTI4]|uniref:copper resistance CopC/CopD family protein n=1 Tax=Herbaspirillum sp. RTI4 TaxID=3048640 RepID=UPI002AB482BB|nr:copper resistance protein CopC [Herbaspirillum sp. RTI4]MDY7579423.1 copper resistance protein CopC [Herbaspirillum sp. RTI4]MEA9980337.1 copper resistance protein CopC [Herbaspirillum sp. RTI4]